MSRTQRGPRAVPVVAVYWISLAAGLVLFATTRRNGATATAPLWIGAVGGTLIGQCLALRKIRMWMVIVVIGIAAWLTIAALEIAIIVTGASFREPLVAAGIDVPMLWQVFVPAVLCGYWSLGDRSALAACWFPAVLWMLTILDRTDGKLSPDGAGIVLLAGFGAMFVVVLRVRESRRVGLWQTVAPVPLAAMKPPEVLKQRPRLELARAGWGVSIGAITVAITAWLAPHLWRLEPLRGEPLNTSASASALAPGPVGLPCCPAARATGRERIKEYLDLGRSHDKR